MPTLNETDGNTTRRSILRNVTNDNSVQNDDEAERSHRRRTLGKSSQNASLSNENLLDDQQGLQNCLKIFHDNKINKDNAWSLTIIDNMNNLCRSHHKTLRNFQIVGSSLEASTKIYGLRVDSVHSDILRMSSGLGRMKSDQPAHDDNHNDDLNDSNGDADTTQPQHCDAQPKPQPVKKKRARKAVSTVTKNKDTLNARLEISQMPDALFFKLNSIMGDSSKANKLLLSTLETKESDLKLTSNDPFWEDNEFEPIDTMADEYEGPFTTLPLKINSNPRYLIRQQLSGYKLLEKPREDDDEEPMATQSDNSSFNLSQYMQEYAFDMAAGIEPMPETDHYAIDYDMFDDAGGGDCGDGGGGGVANDFVELTQEDREAINACKGLRRKQTLIEDLRPADATKLEYSYRPLDNINQFWAGPSYWKFRKSRKLTMYRSSLASRASSVQTTVQIAQGIKRRNNRLKTEPTKFTTLIESDCVADSDDNFISIESKGAQKFKKSTLYKRWDSKRLKLPTDLHIDRNLFNYYTFCPSLSIFKESSSETPIEEVEDNYDFHHADDGLSINLPEADDHDDFDHLGDDHMMDHIANGTELAIPESQQIPDSQNIDLEEISHRYEGAPEMVQKIDIQFARRAKVIDMKQMKCACFTTIEKQFEKTAGRPLPNVIASREERYKDGAASFGIIYNSLPHSLTKTMAENLSPSVAFYSILHLANEHRLRLYKSTKENDMNIFLIRQLEVN